ncbi:MAG: ABC transporter substrate-binding protein [Clostridiales bacterium]|nr:ABC transporter substrate-binding protein [Clostridiales bacterium]
MKKFLMLLLFLALLAATGCQSAAAPPLEGAPHTLTIALDWTPNINHSGLYAAQALGYFAEQGLTVNIVEPGETLAPQLVAAGQAEFGVSYQEEVTFARAQGVPVISLAAVIQHNTSAFAAPASKGIKTVADFAGKRYGGWGGAVEEALIDYLMEREGRPGSVQSVVMGEADFFASCEREVDFSWIYYGVTGIEAEITNQPLDIIMLRDLDPAFDFYTPVIIAEEGWLQIHEDAAKRFMAALSAGYRYADTHPAEAAEILLAAAEGLDEELIRAGQVWVTGQYQGDAPYWGYQSEAIWQSFAGWMSDCGILPPGFKAQEAFTNEYLQQK